MSPPETVTGSDPFRARRAVVFAGAGIFVLAGLYITGIGRDWYLRIPIQTTATAYAVAGLFVASQVTAGRSPTRTRILVGYLVCSGGLLVALLLLNPPARPEIRGFVVAVVWYSAGFLPLAMGAFGTQDAGLASVLIAIGLIPVGTVLRGPDFYCNLMGMSIEGCGPASIMIALMIAGWTTGAAFLIGIPLYTLGVEWRTLTAEESQR